MTQGAALCITMAITFTMVKAHISETNLNSKIAPTKYEDGSQILEGVLTGVFMDFKYI